MESISNLHQGTPDVDKVSGSDAPVRGDVSTRPHNPPGAGYWLALAAAFLLLAGATLFTSQSLLAQTILGRSAVVRPELTYVADLDFWQRTPREINVAATASFDLDNDLNHVPMQVGDWQGIDAPETNQEVMILLEPEQYVQRLYENSAGQKLWLTMVGGRNSQPFHAPDICYDADGWQYSLGSHPVALANGGELYGLFLTGRKFLPEYNTDAEHIVFYFYLFPDEQRSLSDGIVLFKLTSGNIGTVEDTLAMHDDFVRNFFTHASRLDQTTVQGIADERAELPTPAHLPAVIAQPQRDREDGA